MNAIMNACVKLEWSLKIPMTVAPPKVEARDWKVP